MHTDHVAFFAQGLETADAPQVRLAVSVQTWRMVSITQCVESPTIPRQKHGLICSTGGVVLRSYDDERESRVHRGLVLRSERMNDWIETENYSSIQAVIAHRLQRWSKAHSWIMCQQCLCLVACPMHPNAAQCTGQTKRTFHVWELHVCVHSFKLRKDSTAIEGI